MCPDDQDLSALYDGEVTESSRNRIQEHLKWCGECRCRLQAFRRISWALEREPPDCEASRNRVLRRLAFFRRPRPTPLWARRVAVPLPLFAAVVGFLFGMGFFLGIIRMNPSEPPLPSPVWTVQFESRELNEFADLLQTRDAQVQVFIELPETDLLGLPGEPQFIRAANYRRR